jgi:hypothetical protein
MRSFRPVTDGEFHNLLQDMDPNMFALSALDVTIIPT